MTKVEIIKAGERVVEDVIVAVHRQSTPITATPVNIGLVEISQSTPTELIPGPVGPQGPRGSRWYTGTGDPAIGGALLGDMYLDDTTGAVWAWDGTAWVNTGTDIEGPQGATGSQGPQGIQGPQGAKGDTGATGAASTVPGPPGSQGPAGATGSQGPQGVKGDTGAAGSQGPQGNPGTAGATGAAGPGVAPGGTTGQVLTKINATDYNSNWQTPAAGGASVTIADTAPGSPTVGSLWYESDSGNTYIWYTDADSSQWVQQNIQPGMLTATVPPPFDVLNSGVQTLPRYAAPADFVSVSASTLYLTYFWTTAAFTATRISVQTGNSGAAGLTLVRFGIYQAAANGDLTLIASTPNDTALLTGTYTGHSKNFSVPVALVPGVIYAAAAIQVGTTPAKFQGAWAQTQYLGTRPRLCARKGSLTDLPASSTDASLSDVEMAFYAAIRP